MMTKCEHNNCDDYHYPGGTCQNVDSKHNLNECEGCEHETVQEMQEDDSSQGE